MKAHTRGPEQAIARAIKRAQWLHHRALDRRLRAVGATIVQWDVLRALAANPSASAHDLAVATFQSDQSLGVMMRGMEAKNLVTRSTPRGRRIEHAITADGLAVLELGDRAAREVFGASLRHLSAAERHQLLDLLERLQPTD